MEDRKTIVLVLKSGGDFAFRDIELIARHINGKWKSRIKPRIICLWDKATEHYSIGDFELYPLKDGNPGTWSRIQLYGPEMEQFKPFLYIDLDTAVIQSLEVIIDLVKDESQFITLEDFYQRGTLATGLVWFPKNCAKTQKVWNEYKGASGNRMDYFIRQVCKPDVFWQALTNTIQDFKPKGGQLLLVLPSDASIVCFHGKPRIFRVVESSISIDWVKQYVSQTFSQSTKKVATVIIPYKENRGWLNEAIESVPDDVQLIVSQGDGNWPQNFNKVLNQVECDIFARG
jgi:hypothetical protein